jgi:hypothetical protein
MDRPVPIFRGQTFEAADLQSKLEEAGIQVASIYMPHAAGTELQVPREQAEDALRLVQSETRPKVHLPDALGESDPEIAALRGLTKRIGPLALSIVGAPAGFVLGCVYLARVKRLGRRPSDHGHILLAWTGSALMTLLALVALVGWLFG